MLKKMRTSHRPREGNKKELLPDKSRNLPVPAPRSLLVEKPNRSPILDFDPIIYPCRRGMNPRINDRYKVDSSEQYMMKTFILCLRQNVWASHLETKAVRSESNLDRSPPFKSVIFQPPFLDTIGPIRPSQSPDDFCNSRNTPLSA
jgi:hypothetical protein